MQSKERRDSPLDASALRAGLSAAQRETVDTLEQFGWHLRFVRRPLFQDPVPVLFNRLGDRYVVPRPDGTLDESQSLQLRD